MTTSELIEPNDRFRADQFRARMYHAITLADLNGALAIVLEAIGVGRQAEKAPDPSDRQAGGNPEFFKLLDELRELHTRKAADYGRGEDPLANVRAAADFGVPAWVGVMIRAQDKMHRIKSMCLNGSLKNESVEDSLLDLAAYSVLGLVLFREEKSS